VDKHLFLIGYMGCGKTTLGKKLAKQLQVPHYDTDKMIEQTEQQTIEAIFREKGENHFRQQEKQLLNLIQHLPCGVISTGGGFPVFNNNIAVMKQIGLVFYLQRNAKELFQRLKQSNFQKRPLLNTINSDEKILKYIENDLFEREKIYAQANCILERNKQNIEDLLFLVNFYDKNALGVGL
jgi:shikimate kinase